MNLPLDNIPNLISLYYWIMISQGKGYQKGVTSRRTGVGKDRRPDKLDGTPKMFRQYRYRFTKGYDGQTLAEQERTVA